MAEPALLTLDAVSKRFHGGIVGLNGITLSVKEGEFLTLLGPSGCGKTTTLRVIAGFETPTEGRLLLDGVDITALRPFQRPVNTVFQDYALFPHLTVADNVGFGLSVRRLATAALRKKVAEALDLVGLADKIDQRIQTLSGGQRQRVALARAIVCGPRLLLLDEPLSALDAQLREQMQVELKRLQRELGTTFVMVTHDQTEALSISDRIVVMNRAAIEQIASPAELYDRPATRFVAGFIGAMNLLPATVIATDGDLIQLRAADLAISVPDDPSARRAGSGSLTVGIRPEDIIPVNPEVVGAAPALVESVVFHGRSIRIHAKLPSGVLVLAELPRGSGHPVVTPGELLHLMVRPGASCSLLVD